MKIRISDILFLIVIILLAILLLTQLCKPEQPKSQPDLSHYWFTDGFID